MIYCDTLEADLTVAKVEHAEGSPLQDDWRFWDKPLWGSSGE